MFYGCCKIKKQQELENNFYINAKQREFPLNCGYITKFMKKDIKEFTSQFVEGVFRMGGFIID